MSAHSLYVSIWVWQRKRRMKILCVTKYAWLTQLPSSCRFLFVSQAESMFSMTQWSPCYCVSACRNRSTLTALWGGWKVPCYLLNKKIGIVHTHSYTCMYTVFCLNDPFDLWLLSSQEQSEPPSPSLLVGSLSTHNCYASSFLRQWCHGALRCSIG